MGLLDVLNGMQHGPRGPSNPERNRKQRRHVADDDGDPRAARLEGGQASRRQPAGCSAEPRRARQCQCRRARRRHGRRPRRSPEGRTGRPARRRSRRQRVQRRARRPSQPIPAKGPWRPGQFVGQQRPQQADFANDLASALGADQIDALSSQSGLSRDELLQGLSQYLPDAINHLTPDGRLPDENELSGRL